MQFFTDPQREHEEHALPNAEVFYHKKRTGPLESDLYEQDTGWYWWACFPGCLPDGEPSGPFKTAKEAYNDAMGDGAYQE